MSQSESQALIERVRAIVPMLEEDAAEAERLRKPTDRVMRALRDAGLFRLMVPREFGGLELDLDTFLEVGLALGEGDTSMAWVATFLVEHNWMFCQFPEAFQRELYASQADVLAPGVIAPTGQAVCEKDGYRLTGQWQWATGVMHSDWLIVGAFTDRAGPEPDMRMFALPMSEVKIEDTWYVDGMCGTGSNDVVVDGVFVPEGRTVPIVGMANGTAHGASLHDGPLYRTPMIPILSQAASMPLLGTAKACVRRFRERSRERFMMYQQKAQSELVAAQMLLARAELELAQAELLMRQNVAEVMEHRDAAPQEMRAKWGASYALLVQQCRRVVQDLQAASGGSAHRLENPLQRAARDLGTASCHVVFNVETYLENYGRMRLGMEPTARLF